MPFFRSHKDDGSVEISGVPDESPQPPDEPVDASLPPQNCGHGPAIRCPNCSRKLSLLASA